MGWQNRIVKPRLILTGNEALLLEDTVWNDQQVAAANVMINPLTSKPDFDTFPAASPRLRTFLFDGTTRENVTFTVQLSHKYKLGTNLHPHVHWCPTSNAAAKTVTWDLEYTIANIDGVLAAEVTRTGTYSGDVVTNTHMVTELEELDGSGITTISTMLICSLSRRGDTDTYADDAAMLEFDFHYEIDTLGSRTEDAK